jgi:hypothetical protein
MTSLGNALEQARAEALAAWLDERPPREKPDPEETAGLTARRDETARLSRRGPSS